MARFNYVSQDNNGRNYTSHIDAATKERALEILQSKGIFVIEITPVVKKSLFSSLGKGAFNASSATVPGHVKVFFAEQLSTLISGGVPLVRAISLLGQYSSDKTLGPILLNVARDVSSGNSLHGALEKFPKVFDHTWLSMIQAGEVGGHLSEALMQIAKYEKSSETLKSKIITAITYPGILFTMSIGVLIYFIVGIVPTFAGIFKDFDMELPTITKMVLTISDVVRNHLFILILFIFVLIAAFYILTHNPIGRRVWNKFHLTMPIFGGLISNIYYERILSSMSTLLNSGVSIINVLNVIEEAFESNIIIQDAIVEAKKGVTSGKSISESFRNTNVFPGLMTEMMLMGEESGRLPHIMDTLSKFYSDQINQFIMRFSALIDPILICGIGAIIAVVVLSIFMPIFKMSQIGAN